MSEWLNKFLGELNPETVTILATAAGVFVTACVAGLRGYQKGKPSASATAQAIAQVSCGAPAVSTALANLRADLLRQGGQVKEIRADLDNVLNMVTRIEDRTRNR